MRRFCFVMQGHLSLLSQHQWTGSMGWPSTASTKHPQHFTVRADELSPWKCRSQASFQTCRGECQPQRGSVSSKAVQGFRLMGRCSALECYLTFFVMYVYVSSQVLIKAGMCPGFVICFKWESICVHQLQSFYGGGGLGAAIWLGLVRRSKHAVFAHTVCLFVTAFRGLLECTVGTLKPASGRLLVPQL